MTTWHATKHQCIAVMTENYAVTIMSSAHSRADMQMQ